MSTTSNSPLVISPLEDDPINEFGEIFGGSLVFSEEGFDLVFTPETDNPFRSYDSQEEDPYKYGVAEEDLIEELVNAQVPDFESVKDEVNTMVTLRKPTSTKVRKWFEKLDFLTKGDGPVLTYKDQTFILNLPKRKMLHSKLRNLSDLLASAYQEFVGLHSVAFNTNINTLHVKREWHKLKDSIKNIPKGTQYQMYVDRFALLLYVVDQVSYLQEWVIQINDNECITRNALGKMVLDVPCCTQINRLVPALAIDPNPSPPTIVSFQETIWLRNFCFLTSPRVVEFRLNLVLRHTNQSFRLLQDPIGCLLQVISYTHMTEEEVYELMFRFDVNGKPGLYCPCGCTLTISSPLLIVQNAKCPVFTFIGSYFPSLIHKRGYKRPSSRALTDSESELIARVLEMRRPKYTWIKENNSMSRYKLIPGQDPKHIVTKKTSPGERHIENCLARDNCPRCSKGKEKKERYKSEEYPEEC